MSTDAAPPNDLEAAQRELQHLRSVLAETAVACEEQRTQIEQLQSELELSELVNVGADKRDAFMKERTKVYTDVARQMGLGTKQ